MLSVRLVVLSGFSSTLMIISRVLLTTIVVVGMILKEKVKLMLTTRISTYFRAHRGLI